MEKRIIIIGASSGIGMRVATDFARMGWRVGVAARREDSLAALKSLYPDTVEYSLIDVTAEDAAERFYDLIERLGGMDILLYSAGCGWMNPDLDIADDLRTIGVNVTGFTRIMVAAYKYFKNTANTSRGRIAVITSIAGTKGIGVSAAYSASKRYQWTYLQALDQLAHIQHVNVGITDIRPGFVDTDLLRREIPGTASKSAVSRLPMVMSLNYVAPRIVKAILTGKRIATIDSRWAVVTALWRLIPGGLWRHLQISFS